VKSVKSQTVMVEIEVDLLLPSGSKMIREGAELPEELLPVPLDEAAALELETEPMLLAVPIG
jgi:hypothetical protein